MGIEGSCTFMGWTGKGIPNTSPVTMLNIPEKTSVEPKWTDPWTARAIIRGRRVPKSPSEPEISANGARRNVDTL
jgi:hypothetical protein